MVMMEGHVSDAMAAAAAAITDDDGSTQKCPDHPFKNSSPGGICAFCLQEKLGKLVSSSSSFPIAVFPASSSSSSSSSSSPSPSSSSFRSHPIPSSTDITTTTINNNNNNNSSSSTSSSAITVRPISVSSSSSLTSMPLSMATITNNNNNSSHSCHSRKAILPFLIAHKKKKKKEATMTAALKRSKSTTAPRPGVGVGVGAHFLDSDDGDVLSPRRRGFWSFLHPSSKHSSGRKIDKSSRDLSYGSSNLSSSASTLAPASSGNGSFSQRSRERKEKEEFGESPTKGSLERKVARSRSVGCGSRSFSGDFFERISTGFGDCTLRRVESQREGKPKVSSSAAVGDGNGLDCIKERVKCGGIFSGFMMNSSSSSSSSSSYWISSSTEETNNNNNNNMNGNGNGNGGVIRANGIMGHHGRSRSWGWAFASPIRAFGKRGEASNKGGARTTPNLAAIPSLLAVRT